MTLVQVFSLYFIALTSYFFVFFFGSMVTSFFKKSNDLEIFKQIFINLFAGLIASATLYSLIISKGKTELVANAILLVVGAILLKAKLQLRIKFSFPKGLIIGVLPFTILFLLQLAYFVNPLTLQGRIIDADYEFYARLSQFLNDFGIENTNVSYFKTTDLFAVPYHYTEIWLSSLFSSMYNVHAQYALMLIVFPLLYVATYFGGVMLIKVLREKYSLTVNQKFDPFFALIIFAISTAAFIYPTSIEALKMDVWVLRVYEYHKLSIIYPFVILLILSLIRGNLVYISLITAFLAVNQLSVAPAMFLSSGVFFLIIAFNRKYTFLEFIKLVTPMVVIVLFFLCFYTLFGGKSNVALSVDEMFAQFFTIKYYKIAFNIFVKMFLQIMITTIPLLLFYKTIRQNIYLRHTVLFIGVLIVFSITSWAVVHEMHDSVQLFGNIYNVMVNVFIFILLSIAWIKVEIKKYSVIIILFLAIFAVNYGLSETKLKPDFYQEVSTNLKIELGDESVTFVYYRDSSEYQTYFSKFENVWLGGLHNLMRVNKSLKAICLSVYSIPLSSKVEEKFFAANPFVKYIEQQKIKRNYTSLIDSQQEFIKTNDIKFLLMSNGRSVPHELVTLFSEKEVGKIDGYSIYRRL
jgi:hypothetical protein